MIPPLPPARGPGQDGGRASVQPRYEDIAQDGRFQLTALMPGLGGAVWGALLSELPALGAFRAQGILPILRRLVIVADDRPASFAVPVDYDGAFRFAREKGGERLFVNMWAEARAPLGWTLGPPLPADAPREPLARIFAEHVVTRPFAASPADRKVTRLDVPGFSPIPEDEHAFETAEALVESAGGPLEDAGHFAFGMMHTDPNQHVNSLVYPRVFEEMAVARLMQDARFVHADKLLGRMLDVRFRRPFFAGGRARVSMGLFEPSADERAGGYKAAAVGAFSADGPKPSCTLKMLFR